MKQGVCEFHIQCNNWTFYVTFILTSNFDFEGQGLDNMYEVLDFLCFGQCV
uniref:Uncharacterized protein n=1 Tax=Arundo donax TaxID=35708 RepID=A0A0A8YTT1_ARUDO